MFLFTCSFLFHLRYKLSLVSGDELSVDMVFFGDIARDLLGKAADVLLAENYSLISTGPSEIGGLAGKSYVVDVVVSRYSFRSMDVCFQALKFYPEGSTVFVDHHTALVAAAKAIDTLPAPVASTADYASGSGN